MPENPSFSFLMKEAERVYFAALQRTIENPDHGNVRSSVDLPGFLVVPYESGDWRMDDTHVVSSDDLCVGLAVISYKGMTVWFMQYSGRYPESCADYLRRALRLNISEKKFEGGRGPFSLSFTARKGPNVELLNIHYHNYPSDKNEGRDFTSFSGRDWLERHFKLPQDKPGDDFRAEELCFCEYRGGTLLKREK